ncbi:MAG: uracil phosphoribosyltransferase [Ignavibacteriales bacterium]|jgi:uracil phosphoribosyltransferase|nr:uracil phosphoribosyltransferase [Ignavibacteriales bacterium]MBP7543352.1 uracil phosphoribosyltransferase [Ignavibacteriaceae bacterium]MBK7266502.1 uracil phosphoribosyltransferase [Ignavibacteriales bacterium]MBK8662719.1 uracil phosphoribosyltransferase [Ignavibacteriales bacterium]MBP9122231.1 uracil phosphoribosyltransferase [Ignavibacteriaceae bacterium]
MEHFTIVSNNLILRDLTYLRDKHTPQRDFRHALDRIAYSICISLSSNIIMKDVEVETPLEVTSGKKIASEIVLVPILRAGLSMGNAFLQLLPQAKMGHIGLKRNEETLEPIEYYYKTPQDLETAQVIILDPMLATGGSVSAAVTFLKRGGAKNIIIASIISAPEGVSRVLNDHPDVYIYTAAHDRGLNEKGYIVPGLGDAGDRVFGTL